MKHQTMAKAGKVVLALVLFQAVVLIAAVFDEPETVAAAYCPCPGQYQGTYSCWFSCIRTPDCNYDYECDRIAYLLYYDSSSGRHCRQYYTLLYEQCFSNPPSPDCPAIACGLENYP
jgi:hypothetical protein